MGREAVCSLLLYVINELGWKHGGRGQVEYWGSEPHSCPRPWTSPSRKNDALHPQNVHFPGPV